MYKHNQLPIFRPNMRDKLFRYKIMRDAERLTDTPEPQLLAIFDTIEVWFMATVFHTLAFRQK